MVSQYSLPGITFGPLSPLGMIPELRQRWPHDNLNLPLNFFGRLVWGYTQEFSVVTLDYAFRKYSRRAEWDVWNETWSALGKVNALPTVLLF